MLVNKELILPYTDDGVIRGYDDDVQLWKVTGHQVVEHYAFRKPIRLEAFTAGVEWLDDGTWAHNWVHRIIQAGYSFSYSRRDAQPSVNAWDFDGPRDRPYPTRDVSLEAEAASVLGSPPAYSSVEALATPGSTAPLVGTASPILDPSVVKLREKLLRLQRERTENEISIA